jgi:hypothetical protein
MTRCNQDQLDIPDTSEAKIMVPCAIRVSLLSKKVFMVPGRNTPFKYSIDRVLDQINAQRMLAALRMPSASLRAINPLRINLLIRLNTQDAKQRANASFIKCGRVSIKETLFTCILSGVLDAPWPFLPKCVSGLSSRPWRGTSI